MASTVPALVRVILEQGRPVGLLQLVVGAELGQVEEVVSLRQDLGLYLVVFRLQKPFHFLRVFLEEDGRDPVPEEVVAKGQHDAGSSANQKCHGS